MNFNYYVFKSTIKKSNFFGYGNYTTATKIPEVTSKTVLSSSNKKSHAEKLNAFFRKNKHIAKIKQYIPEKYFALKRKTPSENLYLVDENVAEKAASYILPNIKENDDQIVCETNAGLGFITRNLLENGIKLVRLYEACLEFKTYLKSVCESYPGQLELFTKDVFLLQRYEYIDKQDHGNRVEQLLTGVPKKSWTDDPAMTIIGPMPNTNFIRFLIKSLVLQTHVVSFGRMQMYVFLRPRDYVVLTAGPHLNLHTYQRWSVLFNLFFDFELLDKFPREVFLPWQSPKLTKTSRYANQIDPEFMYFVRINFKKDLPVSAEDLLAFHSFVIQFFGKGGNRIIPILEKWVPGSGLDVMIPKLEHKNYFKDIDIFTKFGELTPEEILSVFREMITHPEYKKSHFMAIIESHLIKTETIESSLDEHLEKHILENISVKLE